MVEIASNWDLEVNLDFSYFDLAMTSGDLSVTLTVVSVNRRRHKHYWIWNGVICEVGIGVFTLRCLLLARYDL